MEPAYGHRVLLPSNGLCKKWHMHLKHTCATKTIILDGIITLQRKHLRIATDKGVEKRMFTEIPYLPIPVRSETCVQSSLRYSSESTLIFLERLFCRPRDCMTFRISFISTIVAASAFGHSSKRSCRTFLACTKTQSRSSMRIISSQNKYGGCLYGNYIQNK
jgi:hypothetical protein